MKVWQIIKNRAGLMIAVIIIILSVFAGISQLYIPYVENTNHDYEFSIENAMEYLKVIAEKPHSYKNTKEHSKV